MKVSLAWIREILVDLKATPATIAKRLDGIGFEVEAIESQESTLDGVIVGEVRALIPHPDADKLRIATVFDGEAEHTVVCGAPNVKEGQKIAFAPAGLTIPNGMTLERRKIRGVESSGMICSEAELDISDESDGILVTKPRAKPGKALSRVEDLRDTVYELGVTPNRPDVLSHHGIARELAAAFGLAQPKVSARAREAGALASTLAKIEIKDKNRCRKYAGRVIMGVKVGPSPLWVKRRLHRIGVRSISNVVDATNLVLMELGHPLHAFDLDKLDGKKIVVRTAKAGEKIQLLDETERTLVEEDLVIADASKPVALAGVMGGANSEVTDGTTDILLESAWFDPKSVRRTARRHALHTEASHRFERGVDWEMVETALDRCAQMIVELAGGQVRRGRLVEEKSAPKQPVVPIRAARASMLIGREFDKAEVKKSLTSLGLRPVKRPSTTKKKATKKKSKADRYADAMYFAVPSWRLDLNLEEDLIEEVGRIKGYDNVPALMPPGASAVITAAPPPDDEREVRTLLAHRGFFECISLAFDAEKDFTNLGLDLDRAVELENPLGEQTRLMRQSLVPAMLRAARLNQDNLPSVTDLALFEVGRTFVWGTPPGDLPVETTRVGILRRGRRVPQGWSTGDATVDTFDLKATIESVLSAFRVDQTTWHRHEATWLHPRSGSRVEREGRTLGRFGELHPDVAAAYGLDGPSVFVAELDLDAIAQARGGLPRFVPLPRLPPAQRDLSFFLADEVTAGDVVRVIRGAAAETLEDVSLFDVYKGKGVPDGKKSLAVSLTYRAPDRTLTDDEVRASQTAVIDALTKELGADVRTG